MKPLVMVFCLILLQLRGISQAIPPANTPPRSNFMVKIAPLGLVNPRQQSLDLLVDIPLTPYWTIELGAGLVFDSWSYASYQGESFKGLKLKPAIKYILHESEREGDYLCLAFKYNEFDNARYVNALRQGGQYTELLLQNRRVQVWGLAFRYGWQHYLGTRKNWMIEPFFGAGARKYLLHDYGLPPDALPLEEGGWRVGFDRGQGTYKGIDVFLGCYIGWSFRRR